MFTIENYYEKCSQLDFEKMPEALKKGDKLTRGASANNWSAYRTNENIKRVIDTYFEKLEEYVKKNYTKGPVVAKKKKEAEPKMPSKTEKKEAKQSKPKQTKADKSLPAEEEDEKEPEAVEKILLEVAFIKRYAGLHGKEKTKDEILRFLTSLQRAILEKRIRKTSPFASEIEKIQSQLIRCYESMGASIKITIDKKTLEQLTEIAQSQKPMLSVSYIRQYISLHGKKNVKEKAEKLMYRIKKAIDSDKILQSDPYAKRLHLIYRSLNEYVAGKTSSPTISKSELNGLFSYMARRQRKKKMGKHLRKIYELERGLRGFEEDPAQNEAGEEEFEDENEPVSSTVISSTELSGMEFETIGLEGKYRDLIGDPCVGFTAMVFGVPKSGKSTLCIDFAKHLAQFHGKVLYCAIEEKFGYTLKEKIERMRAFHLNLYVAESIPEDLGEYAFVFIDSVTRANLSIGELRRLKNEYPKVSFIYIFHTTKNGLFRGRQEFAHDVDVIIEVAKGKARANGRFKIYSETNVWC